MEDNFGSIIKSKRKERKWTVREFIKRLQRPLSPSYIAIIESGKAIPNPYLICRIADVFECPYMELLNVAKKEKVKAYREELEEKYRRALLRHRDSILLEPQ